MQALPQGQPRKTISDSEILAQLRVSWAAMSTEEQIAFTEERVKAMEEDREVEALGAHTTENSSFHDVRTTIDNVENQVRLTLVYVQQCIDSTLKMGPLRPHWNRGAGVRGTTELKSVQPTIRDGVVPTYRPVFPLHTGHDAERVCCKARRVLCLG